MDARLRALEQQVRATPEDAALRGRLRGELARIADLWARERWADAPPEAQDLVLDVVARLLGPAFTPALAVEPACGGLRHRVGVVRHEPTGVLLHVVPGGAFTMGSLTGADHERPRHVVGVGALLVGRYPVLQAEWDRLGGSDARTWDEPDLPIEGVSWHDARAWLARAGDDLRLPSEPEWEWACRAGSHDEFPWGPAMDATRCWHGGGEAATPHPPREHDALGNAFGLVDMTGNVSEWCDDGFQRYGRRDPTPPRRASGRRRGLLRAIRGGDAFGKASFCRSAHRNWAPDEARTGRIGFRVFRSLPL